MIASQVLHLRANRVGDLPTDICVDFIEHEQRNGIMSSQRGFDREHEARDFAARCLCPKFAQGFAATVQVSACGFDFAGQSLKLGVASFDLSHALSRAFSEGYDL